VCELPATTILSRFGKQTSSWSIIVPIAILSGRNAGTHRPSQLTTLSKQCSLPVALVYFSHAPGKNILPVVNEMAWPMADQCMALANKMRLVEIAGLVDNLGPGLRRSVAMRDQRCVKPDRSRIELGGETHLGRETALKMTRTQTGSLDQGIYPGAAPRCNRSRDVWSIPFSGALPSSMASNQRWAAATREAKSGAERTASVSSGPVCAGYHAP
jgi:hypothetical protein